MTVQPGERSEYESPFADPDAYNPLTAEDPLTGVSAVDSTVGGDQPAPSTPAQAAEVARTAVEEGVNGPVGMSRPTEDFLRQIKRPAFKVKSVKFNPPVIRYASGARNIPGPRDRRLVFTNAGQPGRVERKGYLVPDVSHADNDWFTGSTDGTDSGSSSFDYTKKDYPFEGANGKSGATVYGFRFMYNPAVLDFGISTTDNVNLGYIASGKATAMPTGATSSGSVISLSFPITRIDDISLIQTQLVSVRNEHYQRQLDRWVANGRIGEPPTTNASIKSYALADLASVYGVKGANKVTEDDLRQIAEQGTMYDLEYLFRAVLGKRWKTIYRNRTADVGLAFGVPLVLRLSEKMVYRVRLSNISFSHKSFTPDMVPMYTDVALSFERIPDVEGY